MRRNKKQEEPDKSVTISDPHHDTFRRGIHVEYDRDKGTLKVGWKLVWFVN